MKATRRMLCVPALWGIVFGACGSSDQPTMATPDAPLGELCNGIDDTDDGVVDEGCPCTSFDIEFPGTVKRPDLVWAGDRYLVLTHDDGVLTITSVIDGIVGTSWDLGPAIFDMNFFRGGWMAWSGSTLAVMRLNPTPAMELTVFDRNGTVLQSQVLPLDSYWSELAWAGDRFVVSGKPFYPATEGLAFAEYASDGTPIGAPFKVRHFAELAFIAGLAASSTTYVVGTGNPSGVLALDRATRAAQIYGFANIPSAEDRSIAYSNHMFALTQSGGNFGGDTLQILDESGAPRYPTGALVWYSPAVTIAGTADGFDAFALYSEIQSMYEYVAVQLDLTGQPVAPPLFPLAVPSTNDRITTIEAVTASKRFALVNAYGASIVRLIQHCD